MINANELRVGNKFLSAFGRIETVLTIMDNTDRGRVEYKSHEHKLMYSHLIIPEECGNQYKPCEISGVPLTPELLEKTNYSDCKDITEETYIWQEDDENGYYALLCDFIRVNTKPIKYLHQLQNIIFDLTGEELQINL